MAKKPKAYNPMEDVPEEPAPRAERQLNPWQQATLQPADAADVLRRVNRTRVNPVTMPNGRVYRIVVVPEAPAVLDAGHVVRVEQYIG